MVSIGGGGSLEVNRLRSSMHYTCKLRTNYSLTGHHSPPHSGGLATIYNRRRGAHTKDGAAPFQWYRNSSSKRRIHFDFLRDKRLNSNYGTTIEHTQIDTMQQQ